MVELCDGPSSLQGQNFQNTEQEGGKKGKPGRLLEMKKAKLRP